MGYIAKDTGGGTDWEPVPTGTHLARCVTAVDLGLQPTGYGTKEKFYLGWEVPGVRVTWNKRNESGAEIEHEGPALIGSRYTTSIHPKSILGQHLVSWRGKEFTDEEREGFDLFNVLGAPCMLSVVHNAKGNKVYANVAAIMRTPQGTPVPPAETELVGYSATHPTYSGTIDKLPEWLKKLALEGQRQVEVHPPSGEGMVGTSQPPMPPADDFDDDIPF